MNVKQNRNEREREKKKQSSQQSKRAKLANLYQRAAYFALKHVVKSARKRKSQKAHKKLKSSGLLATL